MLRVTLLSVRNYPAGHFGMKMLKSKNTAKIYVNSDKNTDII